MFRAEIGIEKGGFLGQTVGYLGHFHKRLILFLFLLAGCIELKQNPVYLSSSSSSFFDSLSSSW